MTLVSKSQKILKRLIKGVKGRVSIPNEFKNKQFHMTIHNHREGAIIPSYEDMYKNLEYNVKYGVITAEMRFGVVNYKLDLSQEQKDLVLSIYSTFEIKIFNDFEMMKSDEIKKVERNSDEYDELFYKFISRNIDKYADDFNNRLKEYNLEITYFNIKR